MMKMTLGGRLPPPASVAPTGCAKKDARSAHNAMPARPRHRRIKHVGMSFKSGLPRAGMAARGGQLTRETRGRSMAAEERALGGLLAFQPLAHPAALVVRRRRVGGR